jgi:hypothetical protein
LIFVAVLRELQSLAARCNVINRFLILLVFCGSLLSVSGCGLVDSAQERQNRYAQITNLQFRMLVDDWDYFWLYDRNSQLTQWHPRVGN